MDVHQAQAFLAVADELHFGRAAERLHMAQPPLSRLIRQIEADLGAQLFERNTRQVSLTPQGAALLEPARELVMLSRRLKEIVQQSQAGEIGRLRLGFAGASVNRLVSELARRVRAERPGITLELFSSQFSHLGLERVLDGSLDLVIGRWDFLPAEVDSRVIGRESILVALPEHHRLASRDAVAAADLASEPWVVLPGASSATLPNRLGVLGIAGGFVPRIVQVAPDSSTQLMLVGVGVGVALTFSGVRENVLAPGVVYRPLRPGQAGVDVRIIWRRGDADPALSAVVEVSRQVFPDS
ncbi:LysR substrate-binding domain-containing protein [Nocardioides sp. BP30]|uniref:LysR family transcriptional regulator n=1 Tax=Nocardioides sp. BP30 TaxID=3036374 RepID=UPI0024696F87|nr:LysR substrate-binding domain-containing protein [Nocardioides sp. BP30]WGL52413.1 LysR substrate-binding domain-containing protein [Nocardioides sp. BP30]